MIKIHECDFRNPDHCRTVTILMSDYMTDEMGGAKAHDDAQNKKLIEGLASFPTILSFLACYEGKYVGLTNGFINFGTFAAKKFLNIHDVIVKKGYRGMGIGEKLIKRNIQYARDNNFGKVTLEVREDNIKAQNLYKKTGFGECKPNMHFWVNYM